MFLIKMHKQIIKPFQDKEQSQLLSTVHDIDVEVIGMAVDKFDLFFKFQQIHTH